VKRACQSLPASSSSDDGVGGGQLSCKGDRLSFSYQKSAKLAGSNGSRQLVGRRDSFETFEVITSCLASAYGYSPDFWHVFCTLTER
jgi:hypothetical protein